MEPSGHVPIYELAQQGLLYWIRLQLVDSPVNFLDSLEDFWKNEGVNPVIFLKERLKADFEL